MPTFHVRVICRECDVVLSDVTRTVPRVLGERTAVVDDAHRKALDAIIESHESCDRIETECEEIADSHPCQGCQVARAEALRLVQSKSGVYGTAIVECDECRAQWSASVIRRVERLCMVCHDRTPKPDSSRCAPCDEAASGVLTL